VRNGRDEDLNPATHQTGFSLASNYQPHLTFLNIQNIDRKKSVTRKEEPVEVEVKFRLADVDGLRRRITGTGAISRGRVFETNFRFDDGNGSLAENATLLRLRQDDRATLTFKAKSPQTDNQFKIQNEYEVTVSDFGMMGRILEKLGFRRQQIYEKWRETFDLNATHLCLDAMPFGDFLEIEGTQTAIIAAASRLGLVWERRILLNYLEIFSIIKQHFGLPFNDVTFDNFASLRFDFSSITEQMCVNCAHSRTGVAVPKE
jgi:adenylate cyclase class 2